MKHTTIIASHISKKFESRSIFEDVSFSISGPSSFAVTGKNGSGKSTLVKIIAGLLNATQGSIEYRVNGSDGGSEDVKSLIGFVSPYLNLYDEFTMIENLNILSYIRSRKAQNCSGINEMLKRCCLWEQRNDIVGTLSSGIKQKLKYAFALLCRPEILILDEPVSNLDPSGKELVRDIVKEQKKRGILIIATSDIKEAGWCDKMICLGKKK